MFEEYSKIRRFFRHWEDEEVLLLPMHWSAAHVVVHGAKKQQSPPQCSQESHHCSNLRVILHLQREVRTVSISIFQNHQTLGLQHFCINCAPPFPLRRNLLSPIFKPSVNTTEGYRNRHRNTAFSAGWYVMLAGTRWRCNYKISSDITKSWCSRSVKKVIT